MADRMGVLRRVLRNRWLRRVELAFLAFGLAEYGVWVSVLVYAYRRGGTTAAAVVAVVQLLPAAAVAPAGGMLVERMGPARALRIGYAVQAVSIGAATVAMLADAPAAIVYVGGVIAASAVTITPVAQSALLPSLVDTPAELIAANVVTAWVEAVSLLIGPATAGVAIGLSGTGAALAVFTGLTALAAGLVAPLRGAAPSAPVPRESEDMVDGGWLELLRRQRGVGPVLSVVGVQFVAEGAMDVLEVVLAINVLALGAGAAGYLGAAFGAGSVIGGVVALALVGRHRLVEVLVGAALAWGAAFVVIGVWPTVPGAFILLCACGVSRSVLGAASRTMLHRVVPPRLHGRVFGMLEGVTMLGLAIGSISVPLLISLGGTEVAWVAVGSLLVIVSVATLRTVRRLDRTTAAFAAELALLRGHPLFRLLAVAVLEDLARALVPRAVTAGEEIVREGEWGGHFYLVGAGSLEVTRGGEPIRSLHPGDGFGEIALLRDGRRTATVTALEPTELFELDRQPFLEAVTGSQHTLQAADAFVLDQLAGDRARTVT